MFIINKLIYTIIKQLLWLYAWTDAMAISDSDDELIELLSCHRPATCQNFWCGIPLKHVLNFLIVQCASDLRLLWAPMLGSTNQQNAWSVATQRCQIPTQAVCHYKVLNLLVVSLNNSQCPNLWHSGMTTWGIEILWGCPGLKMSLGKSSWTPTFRWTFQDPMPMLVLFLTMQ